MALPNEEKKKRKQRGRRKWRVRARILGTANRPRLSVFHSHKHTYAQLIDDAHGKTLVGVSNIKKSKNKKETKKDAAYTIGKSLAQEALKKGIKHAVFDRSRYAYHGRTEAIAKGARDGGLSF